MTKDFCNYIKKNSNQIVDFCKKEYKSFFVGIVTTVTFFISPLKQVLFHMIWKEKASVELIIPDSDIMYGKPFSIDVIIFSKSPLSVGQGVLTLIYKQSAFEAKGNTVFDTPETEQVIHPADLKNTTFIPIKKGSHMLIAQLKTKRCVYSDTAIINVTYSTTQPTIKNWSGKWGLSLGNKVGKMDLIENKDGGGTSMLSGTYIAGDERGSISGFRDGSLFVADFISQSQLKKWHSEIEIDYRKEDKYIRIKGTADFSRTFNNSWKQVSKDSFLAYTDLQ